MGVYARILSKSINGSSIDSDLHSVRARCEAPLNCLFEALSAERQNVERLALEVQGEVLAVGKDGADFDASVTRAAQQFKPLAQKLELAEREQEAARVSQGLCREPEERDPIEGTLQVSVLTFIESLINASFFYTAHLTAGPAAALLASLLISVTNIAVSVAGGYFFGRCLGYGIDAQDSDDPAYARHRHRAWVGTCLTASALSFFHLSVGAIRAQETFEISHGLSEYAEVLTTPESLFLVLIGAVLSAFGWHKGQTAFDDPYPGYGAMGRACQAARDALEDMFDGAVDALEEAAEGELQRVEEFQEGLITKLQKHRDALASYDAKAEELRRAVNDAENLYRAQAARLREFSQVGRKGRGAAFLDPDPALNISFEHHLPGPRPAELELPDTSPHKAAIHRAKQREIERLTQAYEQAIHIASGAEA